MTIFKNIKVPERTHEMLVLRAKSLGMKTYVLAEVLIDAGLELTNENVQLRVVAAQQLTPPKADTTPELPAGQHRRSASSDE